MSMVAFKHNALRNGYGLDLATIVPVARTGMLHNYFSFSTVKLWNCLSLGLRSSEFSHIETNSLFKRVLREYYCDKFEKHFVSDNICTWLSWCRYDRC